MFSKADNSAAWAVGRRAGAVLHRRPAHHRGAAAGGQELGPPRSGPQALHRNPAQGPRHLRPRRLLVLPHAADAHPGLRHQTLRLARRRFAHLHARRVRLRQAPHVRHQAHRSGSLARRRQVRHAVASHAFPQSARPGARQRDAAVPLDREQPRGIHRAGGLHPNPGPRQGLAARSTITKNERLHLAQRLFRVPVLRAFRWRSRSSSSCAPGRTGIGARKAKRSSIRSSKKKVNHGTDETED